METVQGREDYTMIFILVHSFSRAMPCPLHNDTKISTKFTSLQTQTHTRINLEPYKIAYTPYAKSYHIRCTTLVLNGEPYCSVWCKLYSQNENTQDFKTNNAQISYSSIILASNEW